MMATNHRQMYIRRRIVISALASLVPALWLAGCATTAEIGQRQVHMPVPSNASQEGGSNSASFIPQPLTVQPVAPATPFPETITQSGANGAVTALYARARKEQAAGSFDRAGSDFERAMRLAPRNPFVWSALANLHLQMHQPGQAESEASKSNTLAGGNPYLLHTNWLTIASARALSGDAQGARDARQQAEKYAQPNGVQ